MQDGINEIIAILKERHPLNIVTLEKLFASGRKSGLVIVDENNGFCTPGAGNLAPPVADPMIEKMIDNTDLLAGHFDSRSQPILVLLEMHTADHPEPPYPPHCEKGSGEELLVPRLAWLTRTRAVPNVTIIEKGCINGVIGAIGDDGSNAVFKWIEENEIEVVIVVGICTDICVLQFVQALLSARNRDLAMPLKDVVVYTEGCATYNLPVEVTRQIGIPEYLAHDQEVAHYIGLYMMQMSGAILVDTITL